LRGPVILNEAKDQYKLPPAHTFLLVNGFDLDIPSKSAFTFMMKTMAEGKFRFAVLHEWISAHLGASRPACWLEQRQVPPLRSAFLLGMLSSGRDDNP